MGGLCGSQHCCILFYYADTPEELDWSSRDGSKQQVSLFFAQHFKNDFNDIRWKIKEKENK